MSPKDTRHSDQLVSCGGMQATFLVDTWQFRLPDGDVVYGPQFEVLAGRGKTKKWKESVGGPRGAGGRGLPRTPGGADGAAPQVKLGAKGEKGALKKWIEEVDLPVPPGKEHLVRRRSAGEAWQMGQGFTPDMDSYDEARDREVAREITRLKIGARMGDPSTSLQDPRNLPSTAPARGVVDLSRMAWDEIKQHQKRCNGDMAPFGLTQLPPDKKERARLGPGAAEGDFLGILAESGAAPKLRKPEDDEKMVVEMGEYLSGARHAPPFHLMGLQGPPNVEVDSEVTVQLDFKQLYEEVARRGGSVEVVKNHKWVDIAVALIKDAGGFNKKPREEQRRAAMSMSHYFKKYLQRTEQNARGLARDPVRTTRRAVVKQEPGTGHYQQQQELEPAELDLEATKHLWKSRKMVELKWEDHEPAAW